MWMVRVKLETKLGNNVRRFRKKLKMSQEGLGFEAKIERSYVSAIERGKRNPSIQVVSKLAKTLKVSVSDLID